MCANRLAPALALPLAAAAADGPPPRCPCRRSKDGGAKVSFKIILASDPKLPYRTCADPRSPTLPNAPNPTPPSAPSAAAGPRPAALPTRGLPPAAA